MHLTMQRGGYSLARFSLEQNDLFLITGGVVMEFLVIMCVLSFALVAHKGVNDALFILCKGVLYASLVLLMLEIVFDGAFSVKETFQFI